MLPQLSVKRGLRQRFVAVFCKINGRRQTTQTTYSPTKQWVSSWSGIKPLRPFVLPTLRQAGAAASAAALLAVVFATIAVAGDTSRQGGTQARLEAEYVVSLAGIPIGRGNWIIELSDNQYTAAASGTTTGIIRFFTGGRGTGAARGSISAGQPVPTSYGATLSYDHTTDDVQIGRAHV